MNEQLNERCGPVVENRFTSCQGYGRMLALSLPLVVLFNVLSFFTWGCGILSFFVLLAIATWVLFAPHLLLRWGKGETRTGAPAALVMSWLLIAGFLALHGNSLLEVLRNARSRTWIVDVGANTYLAGRHFFAEGNNPYTEHCQIWHDVSHSPNVTAGSQGTTMYGVRYYYGYPYFPMMFAAYAPMGTIIHNYNAIRIFNAVLFVTTLPALFWIARRSFPGKRLWLLGGTLSVLVFAAVWRWGYEIFSLGVTDLVISVLLLFGLLCLSYRKYVLTGILFGLAMACKLLPGPLALVFSAVWLKRQGEPVRGLITSCLLTAGIIILPFFFWNPSAFLSATLLYYLTFHSAGDSTSLWFFLPAWAKTPFSFIGPILVGFCVYVALRSRNQRLWYPAKMTFVAYVLLVACLKMTHLNYLWGIFSLGAFAFAAETVNAATEPASPSPGPL